MDKQLCSSQFSAAQVPDVVPVTVPSGRGFCEQLKSWLLRGLDGILCSISSMGCSCWVQGGSTGTHHHCQQLQLPPDTGCLLLDFPFPSPGSRNHLWVALGKPGKITNLPQSPLCCWNCSLLPSFPDHLQHRVTLLRRESPCFWLSWSPSVPLELCRDTSQESLPRLFSEPPVPQGQAVFTLLTSPGHCGCSASSWERCREIFGGKANQKALLGSVGGEESREAELWPCSEPNPHTHRARQVLSKRAALKEKQTEKAAVLVPAHVHLCFPKGEFHSPGEWLETNPIPQPPAQSIVLS